MYINALLPSLRKTGFKSKSAKLNIVLSDVVKIVNYVKVNELNSR